MFVLDTDVISRSSPSRRARAGDREWLGRRRPCFLSVITVAEIAFGVQLALPVRDRKAETLARWIDGVVETFTDRIFRSMSPSHAGPET